MAYLSLVADFFGVISGIFFVGIGIKSYLSNRKKKPDEDNKKPDQEE